MIGIPHSDVVSELIKWAGELTGLGTLMALIWKARGIWDDVSKFLDRISTHMTKMEDFAQQALGNHLAGIEKSCQNQETLLKQLVEKQ